MQKVVPGQCLVFNSVFKVESENINEENFDALATLLRSNHYKIAVIESITGGAIARKIVETPGCSDYFLGGVIAYSIPLKIQFGQVNPKTIAKYGAVSASVAEEMAIGIKKRTLADITIASTGIAGPKNDVYDLDQNGTVFLSWNICDKIKKTKRYKIEGGRNDVIDKTAFIALSMCLQYIKNEIRKDY